MAEQREEWEGDLLPEEMCSNCGEGCPGMEVEYVCEEHCAMCCWCDD